MSEWQGRSRGSRLGYKIVIFTCKNFGLRVTYFLLKLISLYFVFFSWNSSEIIYSYFRKRQGYSKSQALLAIFNNYYIYSQTILDKIVILAGIDHRFEYKMEKEEYLHEIVATGQGGILLSAHIGNWEVAGHLLDRINVRVNIVMYDGEHEKIKNLLDNVIGERNFNIIIIKNDNSHVYQIGNALQKNEFVCLNADRFLSGNNTKHLNFLGSKAHFPIGPFALASIFKVPITFVWGFKSSKFGYQFFSCPMIELNPTSDREDIIENLMMNFVNDFENKIRLYPEQWFNYYKFWDIAP